MRRTIAAVSIFLIVASALGTTLGYGLYFRGDGYHREVEARLTAFFGMPFEVGRIRPHSLTARQLLEVRMWLPDRRARVFDCPRVVWDAAGAEQGAAARLDLHHPIIEIGSGEWEKDDYMRVLRASLQHDFHLLNVQEIRLHDARLRWPREDFELLAEEVSGEIRFAADGTGKAVLTAQRINGLTVSEAIRITARVEPRNEALLPEVILTVPRLPLAGLKLEPLAGGPVTRGSFEGRITLRQEPPNHEIEVTGVATDVQLAELTGRVETGPIPALLNISIEEGRVRNRRLEHLAFRGEITDLEVDALGPRFGLPAMGGKLRLSVLQARLSEKGIGLVRAAGEWRDASLEQLLEAARVTGRATGRLRVRLNSLRVEDDALTGGDIDIHIEPPPGRPGIVSRELLLSLLRRYTSAALPEALLPAEIEYAHAGAKLMIDDRQVRVLAVEGPAGKSLVTLRVLGRDMPLAGDLDLTFPLDPLLDEARERVQKWKSRLDEHLRRPSGSTAPWPASAPAATPSRRSN